MTLKQEFLSRGDADSHVRFLVLAGVYSNGGKSRVLPPRTSMSQSASCGLDPGVGPQSIAINIDRNESSSDPSIIEPEILQQPFNGGGLDHAHACTQYETRDSCC